MNGYGTGLFFSGEAGDTFDRVLADLRGLVVEVDGEDYELAGSGYNEPGEWCLMVKKWDDDLAEAVGDIVFLPFDKVERIYVY